MYFIVSIDTEEDNWGNYYNKPTLANIQRIPSLQEIFDRYGVKPTYLITYPVANDKDSVEILKSILDSNKCEIGTHLHPWNTPPIEEELNYKNTMLNNLSQELQYRKLETLHKKIKEEFQIISKSFRAGRYGINDEMMVNLVKLKYRVDSSITPYMDWSYLFGPNFMHHTRLDPYMYKCNSVIIENDLIEVPLTVGFLRKKFNLLNYIYNKLNSEPYTYFRFKGIFKRLRVLNRIRLSPEGYKLYEIKKLINILLKKQVKFYNLSFHSPSLLPGFSSYVSTERDLQILIRNIEETILYMKNFGFKSLTLLEVDNIQHHLFDTSES